jgi:hypothetical protein
MTNQKKASNFLSSGFITPEPLFHQGPILTKGYSLDAHADKTMSLTYAHLAKGNILGDKCESRDSGCS